MRFPSRRPGASPVRSFYCPLSNTLKGNTAFDSDEWGFFVDAVLSDMFQGNVCSGNGLGDSNQSDIC